MTASKHYIVRIINGKYSVWYVEKLWEMSKNLKSFEQPISHFPLDDPKVWFNSNHYPTLRNVVMHFNRISNANIDFPVILCSDGHIMDGMHRVAKALFSGNEFVKCVQFTATPDPDFILDGDINDYDLNKL